MNTLEIEYTLKDTRANTQYVHIDTEEKRTLLEALTQAHLLMTQVCCEPKIIDNGFDYAQLWLSPSTVLHSGRRGTNSPNSMVTGVLYNMRWGKQRDFTLKQIEDIIQCYNLAQDAWPEHLPELHIGESLWA